MININNSDCDLGELYSLFEEENILFLAQVRNLPDFKLNLHISILQTVKSFLRKLKKTNENLIEDYDRFLEELVLEKMIRNALEGGNKNVRYFSSKNTTLGTIG